MTSFLSLVSTSTRIQLFQDLFFSVTFCFAAFGVGMQQYINTSTEMDKFNNERDSKDIVVEMSVPATLIEVGKYMVKKAAIV